MCIRDSPLLYERDFVLQPLRDIDENIIHPKFNASVKHLDEANRKRNEGIKSDPKHVLAVDIRGIEKTFTLHERTYGMGIVNCTPDSIQNGLLTDSKIPDLSKILEHIKGFIDKGADMIDVGGKKLVFARFSTILKRYFSCFSCLFCSKNHEVKENQRDPEHYPLMLRRS
eukprot:TRINITY_DN5610_c0_g1_i1.p1 TRINITY_DN5610_c0_g1~~TRINITY_DN5610_c0_g1_i1.p1  ORF type:complete len:182 (+),score=20.50 TRINITY_DN5610_c0_g1_i1:38-547(+)